MLTGKRRFTSWLQLLLLPPPADDADDLESLDDAVDEPDAPSADVTFFLLPDLKSVSYQPPPLRRKPAADIFFFKASAAHSGQVTSGGSLTFCKTSSS